MTADSSRPEELETVLDPHTWDLDAPPGLAARAVDGVRAHRRARRRAVVAAGSALALGVVAGGALVLDHGPGGGDRAPAASPASRHGTSGPPDVDLDGWSFTPPAGCTAIGGQSSMVAAVGPGGIDTSGDPLAPDELRARLTGFSYSCAGGVLTVSRIDPDPVPGPSDGSGRASVTRMLAAVLTDPSHPDAALADLRTHVTSPGNAVRASVPDPTWGVLVVHVAGGDTALVDPLVDGLHPAR
ncbi:hypothetical protein [Phycicoccus sonneratiae]|uniref:Uncharacterized protein n=1 Tax=Phycicoccus sonneratiae TaxID=2807628 RepID=A0ABS2CRT0_9MICO|nr:hypothetical protein [Phycicoccus sonneraticus]MBM6402587.1 hypothetical protein [Phycicoccus sonneraticus]